MSRFRGNSKRPPPSSITITPLSLHLPSSRNILERRRKRLGRGPVSLCYISQAPFITFVVRAAAEITPWPIDFPLIGHAGPRRGGAICRTELLKHLGSSLQPSGEILLSNLGLISEIRSWVKLLYIHSTCFIPGGVSLMFTLLFHSLRTSSIFFLTCDTIQAPLGCTLPLSPTPKRRGTGCYNVLHANNNCTQQV